MRQEQGFEDTRSRAIVEDPSAAADISRMILSTALTMSVEEETLVKVALTGRMDRIWRTTNSAFNRRFARASSCCSLIKATRSLAAVRVGF